MMSSTHCIVSNPWPTMLIEPKNCLKEPLINRKKLAEIAKIELREDQNTRRQCLDQLREWIKKNQDLEDCKIDDVFLLKFLRMRKFSIPMAEQTLLKYLNFRKRFKDFSYNMDYRNNSLIKKGYIFVSPFRDETGRRVIIYNSNKINPQEHTGGDICQAHLITYETLIADEENQILGVNHVGDLNNISGSFLTLFSITEFAVLIRWGEQSIPMRHKQINLVNIPTALKYIYDFAYSNIRSEKLKNRITLHDSYQQLLKKVDKRCLPAEFGGTMKADDMLNIWREELEAKRELLSTYDKMNLLSDRGIISSRNPMAQADIENLQGSFRKLEVD